MHAGTIALLGALLCLTSAAQARIHKLDITDDSRFAFAIETFGFFEGGTLQMDVSGFKIASASGEAPRGGFLFRKTETDVVVNANVESVTEEQGCIVSDYKLAATDAILNMTGPTGSLSVKVSEPGLYSLLYGRCSPVASGLTSFKLKATFQNPGGNYLSAGMEAVPALLGASAVLFAGAAAAWVWHLRAHKEKIHTLHHLLTVLVVSRALTAAAEAAQLGAIAAVGHPTGWSALYYILLVCKSLVFFVCVLLIGTGWSLLKPFLHGNEMRVLMIVIPCQVLVNVAIIVRDEIAPGSQVFLDWGVVLHLFDFGCCVAVLVPVAWTMRSLTAAAGADGKAAEALDRLQRFRVFFVVTMLFLYFSRFGSYVFEATAPYWAQWVPVVAVEAATLAYYAWVGITFRPTADNPYVRVRASSGDDGEFGLDDDGVDTAAASGDAGDDGEVVAEATPARPAQAAAVTAPAPVHGAQIARAVAPSTGDAGAHEDAEEGGTPSRSAAKASKD